MNIKFKVTKHYINKGCSCDGDDCPVALVIKSRVKKGIYVFVGEFIEIAQTAFKRSKKVDEFIEKFDSAQKVNPFEFNLNIKKEYLKN